MLEKGGLPMGPCFLRLPNPTTRAFDAVTSLTSSPASPLKGRLRVPGDKSLSHRALLISAMAAGRSTIAGLLEGEDVLHTANALRALGVPVARREEKEGIVWQVDGVGSGGLDEPAGVLDMGNSGTGARLLMGLLATHPLRAILSGDASLSRRPIHSRRVWYSTSSPTRVTTASSPRSPKRRLAQSGGSAA